MHWSHPPPPLMARQRKPLKISISTFFTLVA